MKIKIFVGSSSESARYAENICLNLNQSTEFSNLEVICWRNSHLFKAAHYTLEDLLNSLNEMSFGIFVFSPDDLTEIRNQKHYTTRDNVLLEVGMYIGVLGRERTFILVPKNPSNEFDLHIPSDLTGITTIFYNYNKNERNIANAVRDACTEIKNNLFDLLEKPLTKNIIEKYNVFNCFEKKDFSELFSDSSTLITSFIHSRKWRESNNDLIQDYMQRKDTKWKVILPDVSNQTLMTVIKEHFDDGKTMKSKIIDVYDYFYRLMDRFGDRIEVYLHSFYPSYSFYKFDDKIIVSLYPLTDERKPTPTFLIDINNDVSDFFTRDIESIISKSRKTDLNELKLIVDANEE